MEIAYFVDTFPKLSETFILNQITGLIDRGHDIQIFAGESPDEEEVHPDVKKYDLLKKTTYFDVPKSMIDRILHLPTLFFSNIGKTYKEILGSLNIFKYDDNSLSLRLPYIASSIPKSKFDIIHAHFGPNGVLASQLKDDGLIDGKIITTFHGYDVNKLPKISDREIYQDLFDFGDAFTVNSNFTKDQVRKLGYDGDKIFKLPVGVDLDDFKFEERTLNKNEMVKILSVGRLVEKKGHEYGIKAISKLVKKGYDIKYYIIGEGELRNKLEVLISELELEDNVELMGSVSDETLHKFYGSSHIFLFPSVTASNGDKEGQGLVLQEAQAMGVPIVTTRHNGIPEGVIEDRSALLVPEKDPDGLARKLEYLIDNPQIWPRMGKAGRKFVEKRYDIDNLNDRLVKIYEAVLEEDDEKLRKLKVY